jgi:hypothetical protein
MLDRARSALGYALFDRACRGILDTPPLVPAAGGPLVVSMVRARDVLLYLIAAKSFAAQFGPVRFHVIDDGSLSLAQHRVVAAHLGATIEPIAAIPMGPTPRGGTWERLLRIADLVGDNYVIQLDSDTLTVGPIDEMVAAVRSDCSFTLVTHPNTTYCTVAHACAVARGDPDTDIHTIAEQRLDAAADPVAARYVHGCSGFAGFARGSFDRAAVYRFSQAMEQMLGRRWWEWGSEQVTSNFMVSNAPRIAVIPYPRYRNFEGTRLGPTTAFIHFIGTWRFKRAAYARRARAVVRSLQAVKSRVVQGNRDERSIAG